MALDLSKLNFFNRLDARARVFVLLAGVIGFVMLVYLVTKYLSGSTQTVGPSRVASAPSGLQSVPGGQITSEYYKALVQANTQNAQNAKMTGGSAVATMINPGQQAAPANQCVICTEQAANVRNLLDDWVRTGKISPDVATLLEQLADKNVPVSEYAAMLDQLVKQGKLTPEQARELLDQYKKQHANALLHDSEQTMDGLIKSGQLPLDVADELLNDQKNGMSPADYAAELQRLVREGKISPETAAALLAQYTQQKAKEAAKDNLALLSQMQQSGEITPDVAKDLADLANRNASVDDYAAELNRLVAEGKLTPAAAQKLLDAYRLSKIGGVGQSEMDQLIKQAQDAALKEISDLFKAGKITADVAAQLTDMIQKNVTMDAYKTLVLQLVQQNKLTPQIAQLKINDYQKIKQLQAEAAALAQLAANNAPASAYADELKNAVANGILSPDEAAQLMSQYQAAIAPPPVTPATGGGTAAFNALQQKVQQGHAGAPATAPPSGQFAAAQAQAQQQLEADRQARIQALMGAMSGQAGQLISSWQPPSQEYKTGSYAPPKLEGAGAGGSSLSTKSTTSSSSLLPEAGPVLVKAGTIIFAVLDTEVNSDYPDSPVLATIVEGRFKGAKLLGKLVTTKSVSGQQDRISLNFSLLNVADWPKSKNITAYAIDPDTAHSVLASSVDYHYMKRWGAIFATSFIQGYASAINSSASTTTTGIFGTSTTHPQLNPAQKVATAIGQIGQNLSSVTQNYVNIPPTVRVDSGVSLGILFMADVTS